MVQLVECLEMISLSTKVVLCGGICGACYITPHTKQLGHSSYEMIGMLIWRVDSVTTQLINAVFPYCCLQT